MRRSRRISALPAPTVDPPGHLLGHVGIGLGAPGIPVRLPPGDDPTKVTARQIVDAINRVRLGSARLVSDSRIETCEFIFGG